MGGRRQNSRTDFTYFTPLSAVRPAAPQSLSDLVCHTSTFVDALVSIQLTASGIAASSRLSSKPTGRRKMGQNDFYATVLGPPSVGQNPPGGGKKGQTDLYATVLG